MSLIEYFQSLSSVEARAFCARFVGTSDAAIDLLRARLTKLTDLQQSDFDYSDESLMRIFEAVAPLYRAEDDPHGSGDRPLPFWANHMPAEMQHRLWVRDGWMHYYSAVLEQSGRVWWDWEHDRDLLIANQPVLVGFRSNMRFGPFFHAGSVLTNAARKNDSAVVGRSIAAWRERIPSPHEAPLPPEWFDGYTDADVNVLVAHHNEVGVDAVWPDKPTDFTGGWRIDLIEGMDIVFGSGSTERLLDYLRGLPDVQAANWGGEDMLVVRAPTLSARNLHGVVLTWLNDRWAEEKERRAPE